MLGEHQDFVDEVGLVLHFQQSGRQAGRQTGRQAGRQAGRHAGRQASRQAGRRAGRHAGEQAGRQAGKQASRQAGRTRLDVWDQDVLGLVSIHMHGSIFSLGRARFSDSPTKVSNIS